MRVALFFLTFSLTAGLKTAGVKTADAADGKKADLKWREETKLSAEAMRPKYAYPPGGRPMLWQRPAGDVKGILLFLHGCGAYATDMFTADGPDGFHLDVCDKKGEWGGVCQGLKAQMMTRQKARKRGYVVAAVQGGKGKNQTRCTNHQDIPGIKASLAYLREKEELHGMQVMLMGFSSGARTVPELAHLMGNNAKCSVIVSNEVRTIGESDAPLGVPTGYPTAVPIMFVYMPHDDKRFTDIQKNVRQFKAKKVKTGQMQVSWGPKHHMAGGAYMDEIIDWCETGKDPKMKNEKPPEGYETTTV